jgi:hypothetical protein
MYILGNLIKANGSFSGAECGCQAEVFFFFFILFIHTFFF